MWVCEACGCLGIAAGLEVCPQCGKESAVPKTTSGGASNAWEQAPAEPQSGSAAAQVQGEAGPELDVPAATGGMVTPEGWTQVGDGTPETFVPAEAGQRDLLREAWAEMKEAAASSPDYASMTQAALRDEAKARELPVSGTKADLAARLAEHDATQQASDATGSASDAPSQPTEAS